MVAPDNRWCAEKGSDNGDPLQGMKPERYGGTSTKRAKFQMDFLRNPATCFYRELSTPGFWASILLWMYQEK
jgi:hypothetical protein